MSSSDSSEQHQIPLNVIVPHNVIWYLRERLRYVRTLAGTPEQYQTAQSFIRYLRTSFLNQVYQTLKSSLHTKETSQIPSYFRAYKTVHLDLCKASSACLNKTTQRKVTQNTYRFSKSRWRWSGQELNHLHGFKAGEKVGQHSGGDETDEALGLEACMYRSLSRRVWRLERSSSR